jgi:hypothetical protein
MVITISSKIEGLQIPYGILQEQLEPEDFHLGGGYDYDHGYLDKPLDWESDQGYRYYLRIPLYTVKGELESRNAIVKIGKPFIIKHEFLTKNDPSGDIGLVSSLVNQFSKPVPSADEPIDDKWIQRAEKVIQTIESKLATVS